MKLKRKFKLFPSLETVHNELTKSFAVGKELERNDALLHLAQLVKSEFNMSVKNQNRKRMLQLHHILKDYLLHVHFQEIAFSSYEGHRSSNGLNLLSYFVDSCIYLCQNDPSSDFLESSVTHLIMHLSQNVKDMWHVLLHCSLLTKANSMVCYPLLKRILQLPSQHPLNAGEYLVYVVLLRLWKVFSPDKNEKTLLIGLATNIKVTGNVAEYLQCIIPTKLPKNLSEKHFARFLICKKFPPDYFKTIKQALIKNAFDDSDVTLRSDYALSTSTNKEDSILQGHVNFPVNVANSVLNDLASEDEPSEFFFFDTTAVNVKDTKCLNVENDLNQSKCASEELNSSKNLNESIKNRKQHLIKQAKKLLRSTEKLEKSMNEVLEEDGSSLQSNDDDEENRMHVNDIENNEHSKSQMEILSISKEFIGNFEENQMECDSPIILDESSKVIKNCSFNKKLCTNDSMKRSKEISHCKDTEKEVATDLNDNSSSDSEVEVKLGNPSPTKTQATCSSMLNEKSGDTKSSDEVLSHEDIHTSSGCMTQSSDPIFESSLVKDNKNSDNSEDITDMAECSKKESKRTKLTLLHSQSSPAKLTKTDLIEESDNSFDGDDSVFSPKDVRKHSDVKTSLDISSNKYTSPKKRLQHFKSTPKTKRPRCLSESIKTSFTEELGESENDISLKTNFSPKEIRKHSVIQTSLDISSNEYTSPKKILQHLKSTPKTKQPRCLSESMKTSSFMKELGESANDISLKTNSTSQRIDLSKSKLSFHTDSPSRTLSKSDDSSSSSEDDVALYKNSGSINPEGGHSQSPIKSIADFTAMSFKADVLYASNSESDSASSASSSLRKEDHQLESIGVAKESLSKTEKVNVIPSSDSEEAMKQSSSPKQVEKLESPMMHVKKGFDTEVSPLKFTESNILEESDCSKNNTTASQNQNDQQLKSPLKSVQLSSASVETDNCDFRNDITSKKKATHSKSPIKYDAIMANDSNDDTDCPSITKTVKLTKIDSEQSSLSKSVDDCTKTTEINDSDEDILLSLTGLSDSEDSLPMIEITKKNVPLKSPSKSPKGQITSPKSTDSINTRDSEDLLILNRFCAFGGQATASKSTPSKADEFREKNKEGDLKTASKNETKLLRSLRPRKNINEENNILAIEMNKAEHSSKAFQSDIKSSPLKIKSTTRKTVSKVLKFGNSKSNLENKDSESDSGCYSLRKKTKLVKENASGLTRSKRTLKSDLPPPNSPKQVKISKKGRTREPIDKNGDLDKLKNPSQGPDVKKSFFSSESEFHSLGSSDNESVASIDVITEKKEGSRNVARSQILLLDDSSREMISKSVITGPLSAKLRHLKLNLSVRSSPKKPEIMTESTIKRTPRKMQISSVHKPDSEVKDLKKSKLLSPEKSTRKKRGYNLRVRPTPKKMPE